MGAGLYLLGMATAGYFIKFMGGTWGGVLQMGFLAAAAALLVILLFSGKLRAQIRVFLSKHFFHYRYDYREEWLKFTQALANLNDSVAEGIIRIMAPLVSSPAGLLWASEDGQPMHLLAHWQMPPQRAGEGLGQLPAWLQETDWVIDLDEWRRMPDSYEKLQLPVWLQEDEQLWLIIPLIFRDRLEAVLLLKKSALKHSINWEDRDLLKTAGRQAATHLAQHLASKALMEARQFDAFNRLSAYVVHDLKNILAQQSLIVSNAAKHRDNPAFVADMISTVKNSVARMQRLMEQMRSGIRSTPADNVPLADLLREVIKSRSDTKPVPCAEFVTADASGNDHTEKDCSVEAYTVEADRERLATVFSHLIQNAQEATSAQGSVHVRMTRERDGIRIDIEDTGRGMDAGFIRDRLFQPFESTKGLTGMGIGAFESRDYIRQLGGDISVDSKPGAGTTFHVTIPLNVAVVPVATAPVPATPLPAASRQSSQQAGARHGQFFPQPLTETTMANTRE
jgi:putative PEP-CTERM system histidine kinase